MLEIEKNRFVERFVEICGTSEPARVQRLLNISYQAAKNYLLGRLPDATVLKAIAEKTPYSIHWLLTGNGEKTCFSRTAHKRTYTNRPNSDLDQAGMRGSNQRDVGKSTDNSSKGRCLTIR